MNLSPDTILKNRYRIIQSLGHGGMGAVYLAFDQELEVQAAIKVNHNNNEEGTSQFLREARLLAGLRHPNLPRVTDYFIIEQNQFLVMDYIPGDDLDSLLKKEGPQPLDRIMKWAEQIGGALTYLHRQNPQVIHRDIKPANLKLMSEDEIMLVDFGIAKASDLSQATAAGAIGYTPGFAPPEQYSTARTGPYSDQFSLAATIYMLLSNQKPVDSVQRMLGQAVLTPIDLLVPGIHQNIKGALEKALGIKPADRFESVASFIEALKDSESAAAANGSTHTAQMSTQSVSQARPTSQAPQAAKKRLWPWFLLGGVALLLLGTGAAVAGFLISRNRVNNPMSNQPTLAAMPPTAAALNNTNVTSPVPAAAVLSVTPVPSDTPTSAPPTVTPTPQSTETLALREIGDGKLIAFTSNRQDPETYQIYSMRVNMDLNGRLLASNLQQLTADSGSKQDPAWSPDGTRLLYSAPNADGDLEIWLIDLSKPDESPLNLSNVKGDDTFPAWSPDGRTIVFTNKSRFTDYLQLYFVNPDGSNRRRVSQDFIEYDPVWSPDNKILLYVIFAQDHHYFFLRKDTADFATPQPYDPTTYFGRLGDVADPAWSPDGTHIAYTRNKADSQQIYSVEYKSLGAKTNLLTPDLSNCYHPTWSPDAQWIAFTAKEGGNEEIYIMTSSGLLQTNLTDHPSSDRQPIWQP